MYERQARWQAKVRALIDAAKVSCIDCGLTEKRRLQFDHRANEVKLFDVGLGRHGLEATKREIAKCDVRCLSCHNKRHRKLTRAWKAAHAAA